jgi:myo-inositol-1(or 4)-monophosphatase
MAGMPSEHELLSVAVECARAAGAELLDRFGREPIGVRSKSTPTDPVSAADLAAEAAIREVLARLRPDDSILGEEGGSTTGESALRWIVDPLDGTVNYLYGIPQFAVSVGCVDRDGGVAGVVLDPVRDECFAATRSEAATVNGVAITLEPPAELGSALVATGFGYDPPVRAAQARVLARVLPRARDIRRAGAAALDLCWCACGRVDAFYERGLKPWDRAAGELICRRAGLIVRDLPAQGLLPDGMLVAPPGLVDELWELVAPAVD